MTMSQKVTEVMRWMAIYCPHPALRIQLLRWCGVRIGDKTVINLGVNFLLAVRQRGNISIGNRVAIAPGVLILGEAGPCFSVLTSIYPNMEAPVTICDDVWIGANAVIFPGVTIGEQSVVGAGAVVREDVPPYSVVVGVPARKVKDLPKISTTANPDRPCSS